MHGGVYRMLLNIEYSQKLLNTWIKTFELQKCTMSNKDINNS